MTSDQELKILIRKLMPMMRGGCYSTTVAINKFQVQAVECSVIFFIIVDSISPLSLLKNNLVFYIASIFWENFTQLFMHF